MKRLGPTLCLAAIAALAGCEETDECRDLVKLKAQYEEAAVRMRARAGMRDRAVERAEVAEQEANKLLERLGLDKSETELDAVLRDRAEALGVKIERGTREIPIGTGEGASEKQTIWNFVLTAKDTAAAVDQSRQLAGSPPLFRYVALLSDEKSWRFRLGRSEVDKLDIDKIKPTPPPELRKASDIPSELGFCGASKVRGEIAALEAEIESLSEAAAQTTVAMPKGASWEGVRRRALQIQAEEAEARVILDDQLSAAVRARVPVKAAGVEGAVVILELFGGAKEKKAFQKELTEKALQALKPADTDRPNLIRYMTMIPAADVRRKQHGPEHNQAPR